MYSLPGCWEAAHRLAFGYGSWIWGGGLVSVFPFSTLRRVSEAFGFILGSIKCDSILSHPGTMFDCTAKWHLFLPSLSFRQV